MLLMIPFSGFSGAGPSLKWTIVCKRLAVFAACCLLLACKRDAPNPSLPIPATDCEEFPVEFCDFGRQFERTAPVFEMPCFNPNNGDEFVYRQGNKLWKHSFSSGKSTILREDVQSITQPSWGGGGWITFSQIDGKVWVMKEDGSELQRVSSAPRSLYPEFNHVGDEIVYARWMDLSNYDLENNPELRKLYKMLVINHEGNEIDSFCREVGNDPCYPWSFCSWSSKNTFAAEGTDGKGYGLSIYNLDGDVIDVLYRAENTDENADFIQDIVWHPDQQRVFFTDGFGIHSVNINSHVRTTIRSSCESRYYLNISISPDGETLIASRITATYSNCLVTQTKRIVKMNIDGSEEEIIELE